MNEQLYIGLIALAGAALAALGGIIGSIVTGRTQRRVGDIAAKAATSAAKQSAEESLIDQLQEELDRFRKATDRRLEALEKENRAYRDFIFIHRDLMKQGNMVPPAWPETIPR